MLSLTAALAGGCGSESSDEPRRCLPPSGRSGSPTSIAQTVELINALPHPVSLNCLLESLDRPLSIEATRSVISLQPAAGRRSPRLLLLFGTALSVSVVPERTGSALLEFGVFVEPAVTVKGELKFPVTEALEAAVPYRCVFRLTWASVPAASPLIARRIGVRLYAGPAGGAPVVAAAKSCASSGSSARAPCQSAKLTCVLIR